MIFIHPSINDRDRTALSTLQIATGLRVKIARHFLYLVDPLASPLDIKQTKTTKRKSIFSNDVDGGGGHAA